MSRYEAIRTNNNKMHECTMSLEGKIILTLFLFPCYLRLFNTFKIIFENSHYYYSLIKRKGGERFALGYKQCMYFLRNQVLKVFIYLQVDVVSRNVYHLTHLSKGIYPDLNLNFIPLWIIFSLILNVNYDITQ